MIPSGDGLPKVIRVAYRQYHIADMWNAFRVNRDNRQAAAGVYFEHRQVSQGIGTDQQGFKYPSILQGDDYLIGIVDDVLVGEDISALVHDNAGAERQLVMAGAVQRAVIDVDHRRRGASYRSIIAGGRFVSGIARRRRRELPLAQRRHRRQQDAADD